MYMNTLIHEKDEKTGKYYAKEIPDWLIEDYGTEFKILINVLIVKVPRKGKPEIICKPIWWQGGLE